MAHNSFGSNGEYGDRVDGDGPRNDTEAEEQSMIQLWERREDIQLSYPHVDLMDNWSSDGDSASSSSTASELLTNVDDSNAGSDKHSQRWDLTCPRVNLLKRARIFTTGEAIDQAIDRWQAYIRSCFLALDVLRHQLVETYIPYALEQHEIKQNSSYSEDRSQPAQVAPTTSSLRRRKALRNMFRHSVKVANRRHLSCLSKFASVSSHLAQWRKSDATQRCRFRDPTTTTWEKPCGNLCVPLLPVCVMHLVQLNPAPDTISLSHVGACTVATEFRPTTDRIKPEAPSSALTSVNSNQSYSKRNEPTVSTRQTRNVRTTIADAPEINTALQNSLTLLQLPTQYLFRRCGGGSPEKPCTEPIVAWTPHSRCSRHIVASNVVLESLSVQPEFSLCGSLTEKLSDALQPLSKPEADTRSARTAVSGFPAMPTLRSFVHPNDVYVVAARRSPIGRVSGALSQLSAHQLGAQVIQAVLADCTNYSDDPLEMKKKVFQCLDEVIVGHVFTASAGQNPARQASVLAGIPYSVPAWGLNMLCGSGLKAVCIAYDHLKTNQCDGGWVLAGGQESMSQAPYAFPPEAAVAARRARGKSVDEWVRSGDVELLDTLVHDGLADPISCMLMGQTAEVVAKKFSITREQQDLFAFESHQKYARAFADGYFEAEITPIRVPANVKGEEPQTVTKDEHPRPETTVEVLSRLKLAFPDSTGSGTVTAGNASGLNDGAAFLMLCRGDQLSLHDKVQPLVRLAGWNQVGLEPHLMSLGPVGAINGLLSKLNWTVESIDLFEINEAFAAQSLAVIKELNISPTKLNIVGGGIALGHPFGCSGARVLVTLIHQLVRLKTEHPSKTSLRGIAALCIGGGMGIAVAVETLS